MENGRNLSQKTPCSNYVFSTIDNEFLSRIQTDLFRRCLEFIGSQQAGFGSNLSKGKRFLKSKAFCSGRAIKRAMNISFKTSKHDFEAFGPFVLYYHKDAYPRIVGEIILYLFARQQKNTVQQIIASGFEGDNFLSILFFYRLNRLSWVVGSNYKGQLELAQALLNELNKLAPIHPNL